MSISPRFFDYQRRNPRGAGFNECSPALLALSSEMRARWLVTSLGCHGVRPIRFGELPSSHSYGAAIDLSYRSAGRPTAEDGMIPWLIAWSDEWGVQAIHDYIGCRIWRAGRTPLERDACSRWWKAQRRSPNGMGQAWATYLHIEVHPTRWADARSAAERGVND